MLPLIPEMADILRLLYIGIAGIEIGFLSVLAYYRLFVEAKLADDPRGPRGMGALALSFIFFLLGSVVGAFQHYNQPVTWPLIFFVVGLLVLLIGTYLVNISSWGFKHFLRRPRIRNRR